MQKISRRHQENQAKTKNILFTELDNAITVLKETATAKFTETVELSISSISLKLTFTYS